MLLAPTLTLSAGSGAAIVRPTFSRDFAGEKTLDNGTGPAITFTRASGATFFDANGTLQTAGNNVPRFDHDPASGASRGLLIEEARTNSFERSAEFDNAYWTKNGATVTANTSTAPDGTASADTLSETIANAGHFVRRSISVTSGTSYTLSVFAKAGTSNILLLTLESEGFGENTRAWFDLSTGAAGSTVGSPSATSIQSVGNGWYRCSITKAATATDASSFFIQIAESDGAFAAYVGDTADNILLWGAQLELGAFPTSYIPTTTAAATRSADLAVVTPIASFYNQAEGTLFAESSFFSTGTGTRLTADNNGTSNRLIMAYSSGVPRYTVTATTSQASIDVGSAISAGAVTRHIAVYAENDFNAAVNGTLGTADTSGSVPVGVSHLRIGRTTTTTSLLNGHIRKVAYYPKRLTNTLLEQLTT